MVGLGKLVKSNVINFVLVKIVLKKRCVSLVVIVFDGESVSVVEDVGISVFFEVFVGDVMVFFVEGEVEGVK